MLPSQIFVAKTVTDTKTLRETVPMVMRRRRRKLVPTTKKEVKVKKRK